MSNSNPIIRFLSNVENQDGRLNAVETESGPVPLIHSFWSVEEFREASQLVEEWDVPTNMAPFYGDWHDLLALNLDTGEVVFLNDRRKVLHTWPTFEEFTSQLTNIDDPPMDTSGVIDAWFDF